MLSKWGICDCGKWAIAPYTFRETTHFLKCPECGQIMYLSTISPKDAGYCPKDMVEARIVSHKSVGEDINR